MGFQFSPKAPGVPVGHYQGIFAGAEEFIGNNSEFGPALKLRWTITGGEYDGAEATRIVSQKASAKSNLSKMVVALNGGPLEPGATIDIDSFLGVRGMLIVEECGDGGATRVATFLRS